MVTRPAFIPNLDDDVVDTKSTLVRTLHVDFTWIPGLSPSQKLKRIESLHGAIENKIKSSRILEISTKSPSATGVALSAFNLNIRTPKLGRVFSVESAYQGSKVFEQGGPYVDLLATDSRSAKGDPRLKTSGSLVGFKFFGTSWPIDPLTAFYDWLYINALSRHEHLANAILEVDAFTDIEYNPRRSINCQAYSAALYVSLSKRGILPKALESRDSYLQLISRTLRSNARQNELVQAALDLTESKTNRTSET